MEPPCLLSGAVYAVWGCEINFYGNVSFDGNQADSGGEKKNGTLSFPERWYCCSTGVLLISRCGTAMDR